jgi:thiol-disulfide isomerase/thioredoxin
MSDNENSSADSPKASHQPKPVLVIFLLLPILGILAALVMVALEMQANRGDNLPEGPSNPSTLVNYAAPDFSLADLNGGTVSLADYSGKILFLNFWQTTCPPCIEELPDFLSFMEEQPDDVAWLTVNVEETPQMVREFFAANDFLGIPVAFDPDSVTRYAYGVFGFPVTFVIDGEGVVRYLSIGALSYEEMNDILASVRAG